MQARFDIIQFDFKKFKITIFLNRFLQYVANKMLGYNCYDTGKSIMTENKMSANAV